MFVTTVNASVNVNLVGTLVCLCADMSQDVETIIVIVPLFSIRVEVGLNEPVQYACHQDRREEITWLPGYAFPVGRVNDPTCKFAMV